MKRYKGFIELGNGLYYNPNDGSVFSYRGNGIYKLVKKMPLSELPTELKNYVLQKISEESRCRILRSKKEPYIDPQNPEKELYIEDRGLDEYGNTIWELVCDKNGIPVKFLED